MESDTKKKPPAKKPPPGKGPPGKKVKPKLEEPDFSKEIAGVTRTRRAWLGTLGLALAAFLLVWGLSATRLARDIELKTVDFRFRLRPSIPVQDDIVMVDIDNESLRKYGRWPWPSWDSTRTRCDSKARQSPPPVPTAIP